MNSYISESVFSNGLKTIVFIAMVFFFNETLNDFWNHIGNMDGAAIVNMVGGNPSTFSIIFAGIFCLGVNNKNLIIFYLVLTSFYAFIFELMIPFIIAMKMPYIAALFEPTMTLIAFLLIAYRTRAQIYLNFFVGLLLPPLRDKMVNSVSDVKLTNINVILAGTWFLYLLLDFTMVAIYWAYGSSYGISFVGGNFYSVMTENGHTWIPHFKMLVQELIGYANSAVIVMLTIKDYKQPDAFGIGDNKIIDVSKIPEKKRLN